jgi:hypothetical protein
MFWLYKTDKIFNFSQIFPYYKKYSDNSDNSLYNFCVDIKDINLDNIINKIIPTIYTCDVAIKDNYIQYINNKTITFLTKDDFVKDDDKNNALNLPYFIWKYEQVENSLLPCFASSNYDRYYKNVSFKIYKINDNKLFIIEEINDKIIKYILQNI